MTATNSDLLTLFAAIAARDYSAVPALIDALDEAGRHAEARMLRGETFSREIYIVPTLQFVTHFRPRFNREEGGQRLVLEITYRDWTIGDDKVERHNPTGDRELRGKPMHYRAKATREAFDRAVRHGWDRGVYHSPRLDGDYPPTEVILYVIDAAEYGLAEIG